MQWFKANKLSWNTSKTKYTYFHKLRRNDYIPLKLPALKINNTEIKREYCIKCLGVLLDECLTWKKHIETIENKISKNIGILYKAKILFESNMSKKCLLFICTYNHGGIKNRRDNSYQSLFNLLKYSFVCGTLWTNARFEIFHISLDFLYNLRHGPFIYVSKNWLFACFRILSTKFLMNIRTLTNALTLAQIVVQHNKVFWKLLA